MARQVLINAGNSITKDKQKQYTYKPKALVIVGGAVASWLMRSTEEQTVRIRALAGYIVLYLLANHFTRAHSASLHPGV